MIPLLKLYQNYIMINIVIEMMKEISINNNIMVYYVYTIKVKY